MLKITRFACINICNVRNNNDIKYGTMYVERFMLRKPRRFHRNIQNSIWIWTWTKGKKYIPLLVWFWLLSSNSIFLCQFLKRKKEHVCSKDCGQYIVWCFFFCQFYLWFMLRFGMSNYSIKSALKANQTKGINANRKPVIQSGPSSKWAVRKWLWSDFTINPTRLWFMWISLMR